MEIKNDKQFVESLEKLQELHEAIDFILEQKNNIENIEETINELYEKAKVLQKEVCLYVDENIEMFN